MPFIYTYQRRFTKEAASEVVKMIEEGVIKGNLLTESGLLCQPVVTSQSDDNEKIILYYVPLYRDTLRFSRDILAGIDIVGFDNEEDYNLLCTRVINRMQNEFESIINGGMVTAAKKPVPLGGLFPLFVN